MNYTEHVTWSAKYRRLQDIADRIVAMRLERARRLCAEAGLDPTLLGIHPHNAMVSFRAGQPWRGVDYSKVRACLRMQELAFEPNRIVDAWDRRVRKEG